MVVMYENEHPSQDRDPFNRDGKRNVRNTHKSSYNCGGYALECFTWYRPTLDDSCPYIYGFDNDDEAADLTAICVNAMLTEFPTMRQVETLADVRSDEYAILFRISSDGDFHFLKRDRRNHWRHKMGASRFIDTIKTAEIFGCWHYGRYDGPIVIFAKKR